MIDAKKATKNINLDQQPIPVIVGKLNRVAAIYVIINDKVYAVDSIIEAFSLTIKMSFSLDCKYPEKARPIWTFLQRAFCKIVTPEKYLPIELKVLLTEIENEV